MTIGSIRREGRIRQEDLAEAISFFPPSNPFPRKSNQCRNVPTIMAAAVGDYLGLPRAAAAFSLITVFFGVGQTLGPGAAGVIAEASGTFTTSYLAAALTGMRWC